MSKLLTALIVAGFGLGLNVAMAQNTNSDKDRAPQGNAQSAKPPQDCEKLSGKEKDKCIQATPAGAVKMPTGEPNKAKSETAKERDREKGESQTDSAKEIPAQSNDAVGKPEERGATGQGQTLKEPGQTTKKDSNK